MRVALHTRLEPDAVDAYERAHAAVPAELTNAIRAAGATDWRIWRSGLDLFHVLDCADYAGLLAALRDEPVNQVWQQRMGELLSATHDYSETGSGAPLPLVWDLNPEGAGR